MMRDIFKMLILLGLLISIMSVSANDSYFGCLTENCTYYDDPETGERIWTCDYLNCSQKPHWVQEEVNVTVMNCSSEDFIDYLENYTKVLESSLNLSEQLLDVKMTRDGYKMQWDDCEKDITRINGTIQEKQNYINNKCMDKDLCDSQITLWKNNATKCGEDCEEKLATENFYGLLKLAGGIGLAIFFIWFFKLRRPTLEKTDVMPTSGETSFDPKAVAIDTKIANIQAEQKERDKKLMEEIAKIREFKPEDKPKTEEIKEPVDIEKLNMGG